MSIGKHFRKLSWLSLPFTLSLLLTPVLDITSTSGMAGIPSSAHAQASTPASGNVYVLSNGELREAFIQLTTGRISQGRPTWTYTVQYLDGEREVEENVTEDRVRTLDQVIAEESGQENGGSTANATPVHDLSNQAGIDQMLEAHNRLRRDVGISELVWSEDLASRAQSWADTLIAENRFEHSPDNLRNNNSIGENIARRRSSGGSYSTPAQATAGWAAERHDYDYDTNSCAAGEICGHYTQMVWANTTEVGCGVARTEDAIVEMWVCQYNPGGNFVGQRPY